MTGSPKVIDALNDVLAHALALHQQAHLEEHWFESLKYSFSDWFDAIETKAHAKMVHPTMNRIRQLGGKIVAKWAWQPTYEESVGPAMKSLLASMQKTRESLGRACTAAEDDEDYVTEKMIWCMLEKLERWVVKYEARIAQHDKIGETAFLAEFI